MSDGRDYAAVAVTRLVDKRAISMLDLFFDHAAPAESMIGELAVPLIVIVGHFTIFQVLFRALSLYPGFGTLELVGVSLRARVVPGVKEFARIAPLRFKIAGAGFESFAVALFSASLADGSSCISNCAPNRQPE